jgi:hypothetical protein
VTDKKDLRTTAADTPEARIAAACQNLCEQFRTNPDCHTPDIADFRDHLRPFIRREILLAELDEARRPSLLRGDRMRTIIAALAELDRIEAEN